MPCPEFEAALGKCVHCRHLKLKFDSALTLGDYKGALRQLVLKIKHAEFEALAHQAAELLARRLRDAIPSPPIDLVTCVPMHWLRRWWRGSSAAEIVARRIAADLRLPCYSDLLRCQRLLRRQGSLLPNQRWANVRQAYRIARGFDIRGAHILLVDDVLTTGATANENARVLRKAVVWQAKRRTDEINLRGS